MTSFWAEGLLLGLATGTTCLATCGPIYAPFLTHHGKGIGPSLLALTEISAGRFVTYILFGALAGWLGAQVDTPDRQWFTAAAYLLFSGYLAFAAITGPRHEGMCAAHRWYAIGSRPFVLGALTGINVCPSFLIALTRAVDLNGPLAGIALFISFFFGTTVFLLPLVFAGPLGMNRVIKQVSRLAMIAVALWFIFQGVILLTGRISGRAEFVEKESPTISLFDSIPLVVIRSDTSGLHAFVQDLSMRRPGPVSLTTDTSHLPTRAYLFVDEVLVNKDTVQARALRKPGRFVVVIPSSVSNQTLNDRRDRIGGFLSMYHFKMDPDSGSIFPFPTSLFEE